MVEQYSGESSSNFHGDITLDHVAHVKDETVRFLEKRSFNLLSFTYSYEPERALEINKTLEDDLDNLLLNSLKQLAYHRLYGDNKTNVPLYNAQLRRLETLNKEVESCYERFQHVKENNPDPKNIAIIHVYGVDDLEKRVKQSLNNLEMLKNSFEEIQGYCKSLMENSLHLRRMMQNIRKQGQMIFFKQVQVASLIDEVALYKGVYLKDPVAEKIYKACLSQSASELSFDSWALRIKYCNDTLENIKSEAYKTYNNPSAKVGVLSQEKEKTFHDTISKNKIGEFDLPEEAEIRFPDINDITKMEITIEPREGIWKEMKIRFSCKIPEGYPHERPRIKCESKIVHPNILGVNAEKCQGAVCLNIIREDWRPIYTISTAITGLMNLLLEPQKEEPLDKFAAEMLDRDPEELRNINIKLRDI